MPTVGDTLAAVEQRLFVGRDRELDIFQAWLADESPTAKVLNVSGAPGVGKTTLLQAFARQAQMSGHDFAMADGHSVGTDEAALVGALDDHGSPDLENLVRKLNRRRSLVLIDTFEQLEHLTTFLQTELLPRLEMGVKVVIAGRRPLVLAWSRADAWPKIVRLVPLDGFSSPESRRYLARRGIDRSELIDQMLATTAGNPLALSLASDLISQLGVRDFASDPQWHVAARSLVRRLLSETAGDPGLIAAVEAGSVIRVFDEATLCALTGRDDCHRVFDQLCRLSIVKPAPDGLMLHDHVRAIIAADLRWRSPVQHQLLRQRALGYFKQRLRTSSDGERGWLIAECFFLWENPTIRDVFFGPDTLGRVAIEPAADVDPDTVLALLTESPDDASHRDVDRQLISDALRYSGTRVRVATNEDGALVGCSMVLPICHESIGILERHPLHAELTNEYFSAARRALLPTVAHDATTQYLLPVVAAGEHEGAARCALFRELAAIFSTSGIYLCMNREPAMDGLLRECNFELVAETDAAKGWVLDLSRIGFEGWIQAVVDGRHVEAPPGTAELETEILSALSHWEDAAWLATHSRLVGAGVPAGQRADVARQTINEAFTRARANGTGSCDAALRALELAYIKRTSSRKQAMRSLSVSRATFYRLCKRGAGALAEHLPRP